MFHGIIVDESLKGQSVLDEFKILSQKKSEDWILFKVEVQEKELERAITLLKEHLKEKFYAHFYNNKELIIVYSGKDFRVTFDRKSWVDAIDYGLTIDIPKEQLDFFPYKFEQEDF